ncbi:MAG: YjfI family protein [Gammaproteobacteria bacterium]|nr:YjfI family protein [Gammaproteobacteria bacterium]
MSKSADYQRAYRERMKASGLVQKAVYILPEHARLLSRVEKALQRPGARVSITEEGEANPMGTTQWTTRSLYDALATSSLVQGQQASLELIEGIDPAINLELREYGELPVQISVSGEQIFVSTPLWDESQVRDPARFNELALMLNPLNPLSNLGLTQVNGRKTYIMFGELSSTSLLSHVIEEIEMLAENTLEAAEAFGDELVSA